VSAQGCARKIRLRQDAESNRARKITPKRGVFSEVGPPFLGLLSLGGAKESDSSGWTKPKPPPNTVMALRKD